MNVFDFLTEIQKEKNEKFTRQSWVRLQQT